MCYPANVDLYWRPSKKVEHIL